MQLTIGDQTFDGGYRSTVCLNRQHRAGLDCRAIHVNGARATLAGVTPDIGSRKTGVLTNEVDEQRARLYVAFVVLTVDID
jgi:hypothetical protein